MAGRPAPAISRSRRYSFVGPLDGIEVARALRSQYHVPVIFLSGFADSATIERAKAAQPVDFLVKPFRPSQVFNAIEAAYAVPISGPSVG